MPTKDGNNGEDTGVAKNSDPTIGNLEKIISL